MRNEERLIALMECRGFDHIFKPVLLDEGHWGMPLCVNGDIRSSIEWWSDEDPLEAFIEKFGDDCL